MKSSKLKEMPIALLCWEKIDKEFKFGELVEPPTNLVASSDENQLISIPVSVELKDESGGFTYKPQGFKVFDKTEKYAIVDMKVTEKLDKFDLKSRVKQA
jgi:hypothetical protein